MNILLYSSAHNYDRMGLWALESWEKMVLNSNVFLGVVRGQFELGNKFNVTVETAIVTRLLRFPTVSRNETANSAQINILRFMFLVIWIWINSKIFCCPHVRTKFAQGHTTFSCSWCGHSWPICETKAFDDRDRSENSFERTEAWFRLTLYFILISQVALHKRAESKNEATEAFRFSSLQTITTCARILCSYHRSPCSTTIRHRHLRRMLKGKGSKFAIFGFHLLDGLVVLLVC